MPAAAPASGAPSGLRRNPVPVALGLAILVALAAVLLSRGGDDPKPTDSAAGEVFLEPAAAVGADPFSADYTPPPAPTGTPDAFPSLEASPSASAGESAGTSIGPTASGSPEVAAVRTTVGTNPGLYGGTRDQAVCDKAKLLAFLKANPDKGKAWAAVQGITVDQLDTYFADLVAVRLRHATRVTNHGFKNGVATPKQSVLQEGTAVLIDKRGLPRARCACGNPLQEPVPVSRAAKTTGTPWAGYSAEKTVAIKPGPAPVERFVVSDPVSGEVFELVAGGDGVAPSPSPSAPPASQFDPGAPCSAGPAKTNVVKAGRVSASSEFNRSFPARLAVDGKKTTSWFSKGAKDGASSTYTWTANALVCVEEVAIFGNGRHPQYPRNFGFHAVRVELLGSGGKVVASQTVQQPGTPDAGATLDFSKIATGVRLVWAGHEAPNCGGFSELEVHGGTVDRE